MLIYESEPIGGEITVECENEIVRNTTKIPLEEAPEKQLKVGNSASSVGKSQRKGCYYTSIPRVVKCKGMSGQELTSLNLDKVGIHTLLNVWSLKSNCDKRLTTINSLTLNFTYYCLLICALFWCTFSDTIIRNLTGKRLWRF